MNLSKKRTLLILGKTPPPIGGVTIHVKRLLEHLESDEIAHRFVAINPKKILEAFKAILTHHKFHLHTSNIYLMFALTFWGRLCGVIPIITLHSDFARFRGVKRVFLKWSIKLAKFPIVLNDDSYHKAKAINPNTREIPAFIDPIDITPLNDEDNLNIINLKRSFKELFYSSAFNVSLNKAGEEVYGISKLVTLFTSRPEKALVVSDPSGNYRTYLTNKGIKIPNNVKLISHPHDSIPILKIADCYIRATSTDGDSLSVKEALFFGTPVLASDCVSRAKGVLLFKNGDFNDLGEKIDQFLSVEQNDDKQLDLSGYPKLFELYELA